MLAIMDVDEVLFECGSYRPMTRVEYHKLAEAGFFDEDERVELLFGLVIPMAPPDPAHNESICRVDEAIRRQLGSRARVRTNMSFAASEISEPEPDVMVVPVGSYWTNTRSVPISSSRSRAPRCDVIASSRRSSMGWQASTSTGSSIMSIASSRCIAIRTRARGAASRLTIRGRRSRCARSRMSRSPSPNPAARAVVGSRHGCDVQGLRQGRDRVLATSSRSR